MKQLDHKKIQQLEDMAYEIRRHSIEMVCTSNWGHIGGSMSMGEILAVLYSHVMEHNPKNPASEMRDVLVLSKAHSSPALYSALALHGYFDLDKLHTYCQIGGLEGHLSIDEPPGIENSGGSLGTGLSYAAGLCYGMRLKENYASRVYCIVGDGECSEGQIWEAAMFAGHYKLENLVCVLDYNRVMAKGFVRDGMSQEPAADRWKSFGWDVIEVDGHDVQELAEAFHNARYIRAGNKPVCIIAHTVKGYGVRECEFNYNWHTHSPSVEQANRFLKDMANRFDKEFQPITRKTPRQDDGSLRAVIGG